MNGSSQTRRPRSSRPSARSSRATSGSSMRSQTEWIESLSPWPEDGFGLDRMRALLAELGNPQLSFPAVHVVGTNGKGTTTRTIEETLTREGLLAGGYYS